MAFQLSPGVNVSEIDLTTVVPSVATSTGAFAGQFAWGPVGEIVNISNENRLADTFGKPNSDNFTYWYSAANFLAYSNNLRVVRISSANLYNATSNTDVDAANTPVLIKNSSDFELNYSTSSAFQEFAAKYAGTLGNGIKVSVCPSQQAFSSNVSSIIAAVATSVSNSNTVIGVSASVSSNIAVGDFIALTNTTGSTVVTTNYVEVTNVTTTNVTVASAFTVGGASTYTTELGATSSILRKWKYADEFTDYPATSDYVTNKNGSLDEMHIVVVDATGNITGIKNTIIEKFGFVSKALDAKTADGSSNYYKDVINNRSKYLWTGAAKPTSANNNWGVNASGITFSNGDTKEINRYYTLANGADGTVTNASITTAYDLFSNPDTSDISLLISGPANGTVAASLTSIVDSRKDCLLFLSPERADVVDNAGSETADILSYRNSLTSSSYVVMDSGWKYQYDKYNDVYRWVPLNGDIAGLNARTDLERDPWFSPAGSNRGVIKNVIKLAWNPSKADRDDLYLKGVNPVVTFPGEGTILYGDKTMLSRPSAFDRINVRRLFVVLEKTIAKAARSTMFEFNDQFTRAQFISLVEPYLRDVQGRRGITDFRVVCDETNNTPEVIDRNEFVGDIYIKPARSVNFIQLNFVAVRTGVNFDEIVGKF